MANGTIKTLNPYEATKPIINITPNKAVMNPEQKIKIELSVANNTIDTMSATFNGKPITVKEGITEVTVKDYLSNGKTGVLTVTATNNLGTTTKSMNITADDSVSYGMKLYLEKNQTLYAWSTVSGAVEALNGAATTQLYAWVVDGATTTKLMYRDWETDRKSTRLNSSHSGESRMPSSA